MKKDRFIKNSIFVMILIILGKILALVRDSLIAAKFGATYITDIYNFALGVVYLLTTISYGLTTTFIPMVETQTTLAASLSLDPTHCPPFSAMSCWTAVPMRYRLMRA